MSIHHATVKRAASQGFLIADSTENEDAFRLTVLAKGSEGHDAKLAKAAGPEFALEGDDAKAMVDAIPAIRMALIEHRLTLEQPDDFGISILTVGDETTEWNDEPVDFEGLSDAIDAAAQAKAEAGIEDEPDEEDDDRASVVPFVYKRRYAEAGHPAHCGDWLAETLNAYCLGDEGAQIETTLLIADANGVDGRPYLKRKTRGWQGRFRMTTRNRLVTAIVKANGVLHVPAEASGGEDLELQAPADWVAAKTAKKAKGKAAVEA